MLKYCRLIVLASKCCQVQLRSSNFIAQPQAEPSRFELATFSTHIYGFNGAEHMFTRTK